MTSSFGVLMKCYDITDFFAHWILSSLFVKIIWPEDLENTLNIMGTEAEIQIAEAVSRLQHLFLNPSWLVWGKASRHQKLAPTFSWIDKCLMVTKCDFLKMEASLWPNEKSWVSIKAGCLPYAFGKQPSIPLINLGRKWTLSWCTVMMMIILTLSITFHFARFDDCCIYMLIYNNIKYHYIF